MSEAITLKSSVRDIRGVGPEMATRLAKLGIHTVQQLIEHLPRRVEDRSQLRPINELTTQTPLVIRGVIEKISSRVSKRGIFIISAHVRDDSGHITALWFNQRFLLSALRTGQRVTLYGEKRPIKSMGFPFIVKKIIDQPEFVPIYPLTNGLTQAALQKLIAQCRPLLKSVPEIVPDPIRTSADLPVRPEALQAAHFSPTEDTIAAAVALLGYEELLATCFAALTAKRARQLQASVISVTDLTLYEQVKSHFSFALTDGQTAVIGEIANDLGQKYPMNRVLYGEVGSGKTAVGLVAAAAVALSGMQVLWLSPTVTLANQQAKVTTEFMDSLKLKTALVTSATKQKTGGADIVVGTHALLHAKTLTDPVGLVIIDEQQRFGVEQRNLLLDRFPGAHLLMLSATPIPRTLAHTLFGHLDISYLTEKPSHQQKVVTKVFRDTGREKVEAHLRERLAAGQPGFVICPLINEDDSESITLFDEERKAVTTEFKRIQKVFPDARVGLMHGRLLADEKANVMERFHEGKLDILVATTVVEVGIDNPNATWILIEEADRFGLSQLHQLRGRVGRGSRPSVCFLHNSLSTDRATERLQALATTENGLEIAELDLRLRGPGDIAGHDQSGLPGIRYADLGNADLVRDVYRQAETFGIDNLGAYPNLARAVKRITKDGLAAT
jgi:ATP-dependent DNA helicase RecG